MVEVTFRGSLEMDDKEFDEWVEQATPEELAQYEVEAKIWLLLMEPIPDVNMQDSPEEQLW